MTTHGICICSVTRWIDDGAEDRMDAEYAAVPQSGPVSPVQCVLISVK
jgi:hypothetical protein